MVVNIDSIRVRHDLQVGGTKSSRPTKRSQGEEAESNPLTIGILNNMAGAAFRATERQFVSLLDSASAGIPIHIRFYILPGLSTAEAGGQHFAAHYSSVESIFESHLDGLIVTGREPKTTDLRDETYWEPFTHVVDWARENTFSTVWSCLAAHAAVLHLDGIGRRRNEEKKFGVFDCTQGPVHHLMNGIPRRYCVPHSRWNGVAQKDLTARGYSIVSRMGDNGADTFVKQEKSLFVFFQGHLEYETDTILREYRRDAGRYLKGETNRYPLLPHAYFDRPTEEALMVLRNQAAAFRTADLLANVTSALAVAKIENTWQTTAFAIYRNWLEHIRARKSESEGKVRPITAVSAAC